MAGQLPVFHPWRFLFPFYPWFFCSMICLFFPSLKWIPCIMEEQGDQCKVVFAGKMLESAGRGRSPLSQIMQMRFALVSHPLAPRWVDWFQISLFSYFSIVDFSTGIKMELFSFEGIVAKSWQNHGKLENRNKLLYFHSWGRNKWVSSFEGDEDDTDKVYKWWWSIST